MHLTFRKWITVNAALLALLFIAVIYSMEMGSSQVVLSDALGADERAKSILFLARLPRTLLAAFVGIALASAGGTFQALLRNRLPILLFWNIRRRGAWQRHCGWLASVFCLDIRRGILGCGNCDARHIPL